MHTPEIYESIEAYLAGRLSGAALTDFETRLQADAALVAQVALFKEMDKAVGEKNVLNFQRLVEKEGAEFIQRNPEATIKNLKPYRRYLAIAVSLLLLITAFLFWKKQSATNYSGEELFAQNFETYDLSAGLRSDDPLVSLYNSAVQKYEEQDFVGATALFKNLVNSIDQNSVFSFCLANAYLNQKPPQFELAESQFLQVIADANSIYVIRSKWYMALIYLKREESKKAALLLQEVASSGDNLSKEAVDLLNKIKQ